MVRPLPFELAVLPHRLYKWLRLPVVSYALPALIAIGQARYEHRKPRNPLTAALRYLSRAKSLDVLTKLQPANGGFLEAAPLTSFVVMSLVASGHRDHQVVSKGVEFLAASIREDGSWPIDTNLATWVTTLSISALANCGVRSSDCGLEAIGSIRDQLMDWLLSCQHRQVHPYTHAEPGGWAWSNLSGAVPDGDDTAGAILALYELSSQRVREKLRALRVAASNAALPEPAERVGDGLPGKRGFARDRSPTIPQAFGLEAATCNHTPSQGNDATVIDAVSVGVDWLLGLQNSDGGIPTFCRGWTKLPFDKSSPDITAHALGAMSVWLDALPSALRSRTEKAMGQAVRTCKTLSGRTAHGFLCGLEISTLRIRRTRYMARAGH